MSGIAGPIQQTLGQVRQQPQMYEPGQPGFGQQPQQPGQMPQKPGQPFQMTLPDNYQSPFASYGFDPGLQSYLDQQMYRSYTDGGVGYQYDPTNQTFTGGTMSGRYNPIPLNVMQQAAGGNRDVLSPYFQSKFPQQPAPTVKPGPFVAMLPQPGMNINQLKEMYRGQPQQSAIPGLQDALRGAFLNVAPGSPTGYPTQPVATPPVRPGPFEAMKQRYQGQPQPQTQPQNIQRGLGGLQLNKFRNRLDQR